MYIRYTNGHSRHIVDSNNGCACAAQAHVMCCTELMVTSPAKCSASDWLTALHAIVINDHDMLCCPLQGTMTHMAPEVLLHGKISRASDVYAFGILLWELITGGHAYRGVPRAVLGHEVTKRHLRPAFPRDTPFDYQLLACRWVIW